jgi:tetratricopeptide (TPR) repeat protein
MDHEPKKLPQEAVGMEHSSNSDSTDASDGGLGWEDIDDVLSQLDLSKASGAHQRPQAADGERFSMSMMKKVADDIEKTIATGNEMARQQEEEEVRDLVLSGRHKFASIHAVQETAKPKFQRNTASFEKPKKHLAGIATTLSVTVVILITAVFLAGSMIRGSEANSAMTSGRHALQQQNYQLARIQFNRAIELGKTDAEAYFCRGITNMHNEDFESAVKDYSEAISRNGNNAQFYIGRAAAAIRLRKYDDVIKDCTRALSLDPKTSEAYLLRGVASARQSLYAEALADCDSYLKMQNGKAPAEVSATRAYALLKQGKPDLALKEYNKLVAENPQDGSYLASRALCFKELKQYQKAIADSNAAIKILGKRADLLLVRGNAYRLSGNATAGLADLEKSVELERTMDGLRAAADASVASKQYGKAMHYFNECLKNKPGDDELSQRLKEVSKFVKGPEKILLAATEPGTASMDALKKLDAKELVKRGYSALSGGVPHEAVSILTLAVRKDPNDPLARKYLIHALLQSNNPDGAYEQMKALETLGQASDKERLTLGSALLSKRPQAAVGLFGKSLAADNRNSEARFGLIRAYILSGDRSRAIHLADEGLKLTESESEKRLYRQLMDTAQQKPGTTPVPTNLHES